MKQVQNPYSYVINICLKQVQNTTSPEASTKTSYLCKKPTSLKQVISASNKYKLLITQLLNKFKKVQKIPA